MGRTYAILDPKTPPPHASGFSRTISVKKVRLQFADELLMAFAAIRASGQMALGRLPQFLRIDDGLGQVH
jgi:hypothetical protein